MYYWDRDHLKYTVTFRDTELGMSYVLIKTIRIKYSVSTVTFEDRQL